MAIESSTFPFTVGSINKDGHMFFHSAACIKWRNSQRENLRVSIQSPIILPYCSPSPSFGSSLERTLVRLVYSGSGILLIP